jgi:iron complex outermembrane recepter protein
MLKICMATVLVVCSLVVQAQHVVRGYVKDAKSNESLVGATISLNEINRYAITNERGDFEFQKLMPGNYQAEVRFLGYMNVEIQFSVPVQESLTFLLEEDVVMTDQVIVTATRVNEKTPTTYSTINKVTLQKQNFGQDLPFTLNWTPSLVTTSDAGAGVGYTGLRIRGSETRLILLLPRKVCRCNEGWALLPMEPELLAPV